MASQMFYLEIGEQVLRVLDCESKNGMFTIQSAGVQPIQFNIFASQADDVKKSLSESIKKLLEDSKITKRNVTIVIPDSHSYSRVITMPSLTEKELISAIRFQADQFIPIPIDKVNLDIEVLDEDKQNKQLSVLLVAAKTNVIQRIGDILKELGLFPEVLINQASSSLRYIDAVAHAHTDAFPKKENSSLLFLQCGYSASSLYLLDGKTFLPIQIHTFPLGLEIFNRALRSNFQIDEQTMTMLVEKIGFRGVYQKYNVPQVLTPVAREYLAEINRFLVSISQEHKQTIQSLYLMGAGAKLAGLDSLLSQQLKLPTSAMNPMVYMNKNEVVDYFASDWISFVALLGATVV